MTVSNTIQSHPVQSRNVRYENNQWQIPDQVTLGFILGDGIGTDVTPAAIQVTNAAVMKAYHGSRSICWEEIIIGEKAQQESGELLPQNALEKIRQLRIVLKGPLMTPIGGGHRSLNVTLRQEFDLYACVRPVRSFAGIPTPVKHPELLDIVIFRENTEDVYAGIEWESRSADALDVIAYLKTKGKNIREDAGIGIKPISKFGSERLVRAAMSYALAKKRKSLTIVHKGNIMKYTEGAFQRWAYELLKREYASEAVFEEELSETGIEAGNIPKGKILVKNRIADAMFQQILLRPDEYDVIATTNLNGDYLSDAAAAQVGGLGIAPGANIGDGIAIFEATHGTAPKYAGQDKVNPGSIILSSVMMLEFMGWHEAAQLIVRGLEKTLRNKTVTYDLARQMEGATLLTCSAFADAVVHNS